MKKSIIFLALVAILFSYSEIVFSSEAGKTKDADLAVEKKEPVPEKKRYSFSKKEISEYVDGVIKENRESIKEASKSREMAKLYSLDNRVAEEASDYMEGCSIIIDKRENCNANMEAMKKRLLLLNEDQSEFYDLVDDILICRDRVYQSATRQMMYNVFILGKIKGKLGQ